MEDVGLCGQSTEDTLGGYLVMGACEMARAPMSLETTYIHSAHRRTPVNPQRQTAVLCQNGSETTNGSCWERGIANSMAFIAAWQVVFPTYRLRPARLHKRDTCLEKECDEA